MCLQKSWDAPKVIKLADSLLENAPDDDVCWLSQLLSLEHGSMPSLHACVIFGAEARGWMTIPSGVRASIGSTLYRPHACRHCGANVDHLATHAWSQVQEE